MSKAKKLLLFVVGAVLFSGLVLSGHILYLESQNNFGARTDNFWNSRTGTYLETAISGGYNILINGTNKYLNFNTTSGTSGYGVRDNGGAMEFKNLGGSWSGLGSGSGASTTINGVDGPFTFATGTDVNVGLIISTSSRTLTFTPTWSGTLSNARIASSSYWKGYSDFSNTATGLTYSNTTGVTSLISGYNIPLLASTTNWNTAYTDSLKWDGGSTDLVAATGRTSLGLGTMALLSSTGSSTIVSYMNTPSITIASSTWNSFGGTSGTTTLGIGFATDAETWASYGCFTDTATTTVNFGDGTNWMTDYTASGAPSLMAVSSNNTFTALEKRYIRISRFTGTPNYVTCTVKKSVD